MRPSLKSLPRRGVIVAAAVSLLGCGTLVPAQDPNAPVITGTASYKARVTMPAAAIFEATLEDVSRADAPAVVIASVRMERLDPPPFRFRIPYDPAKIVPGHRYVVRARITLNEVLRFTTDTAYPVLGPDGNKHVKLEMTGDGGGYRPLPGT